MVPAADPLTSAKTAHLRYVTGDEPGITRRRHGKNFSYLGIDSKPLHDQAALQRIRSLVIPPAWEHVWICPFENGHIQAIGRDARGRKQYRYHPRYRQVRDEAKFDRMLAFGAVLPKIRTHVNQDLSLPDLPRRKVVAAIVRLLDETCIRVGNEEYARTNKSFGLTTLRNRHADVHGTSIHFHFRGKSHQEHDITLRDRRLARIVKRCQDLPGQELFEYQLDTGEPVNVTSSDVNEYLREITQEHFTAKDFRTWHGTGHMARELVALGPAGTETETKRNIVQAVKETARHLGNRPAACRKYYIHPAVFLSYTEQTIFSVIQNIPDDSPVPPGGLRPFERAVLRLVESYAAPNEKPRAKQRKIAA
ncbi:MAG: DNA topoisomerase IB [Bryobacteraceae bacterium]